MNTIFLLTIFLVMIDYICCRDYYMGMFKKNDLLVAQDRLYKERIPFRRMYAKYGRIFKCKITYVRVVDRLGYGPGPKTEVIRGGLQRKYIVLRLTSPYNMPISVNIYVGCANQFKTTTRSVSRAPTTVNTTGTYPDTTSHDNGSETPHEGTTGGHITTGRNTEHTTEVHTTANS